MPHFMKGDWVMPVGGPMAFELNLSNASFSKEGRAMNIYWMRWHAADDGTFRMATLSEVDRAIQALSSTPVKTSAPQHTRGGDLNTDDAFNRCKQLADSVPGSRSEVQHLRDGMKSILIAHQGDGFYAHDAPSELVGMQAMLIHRKSKRREILVGQLPRPEFYTK